MSGGFAQIKYRARTRPTQVYSDEIMCVEGAAMDQELDYCRQVENVQVQPDGETEEMRNCGQCSGQVSPSYHEDEIEELARLVRGSGHLVDLIQRYKNVGSDIFKMFQDRINQVDSNISSRWNIPGNLDMETQQRLTDELLRITNAPCDFPSTDNM